jgi:hypothetical protein
MGSWCATNSLECSSVACKTEEVDEDDSMIISWSSGKESIITKQATRASDGFQK